MSDENQSRRRFIKQVGAVPITSVLAATDSQDSTNSADLEHLLISEEHIGDEFTKYDTTGAISDKLIEKDPMFERAKEAQTSFVKGEDPENPQWVVCSVAVRTPEQYNQEEVIDAEAELYDEFVRSYNQETPVEINFEQSQTSHENHTDLSYRVSRTVQVGDQRPLTYPLFEERFRIQFLDQTLLMTLVFGPNSIVTSSVDEMVDEFAALQHKQYAKA